MIRFWNHSLLQRAASPLEGVLMVSVYDIKPRFQALLRPLTRRLAGAGVTANQVTLAALALSSLAGGAVACFPARRGVLLVVPLVLLARMGLNAIDGMLAREHAMKSDLGAVLNELGDVVSDAALYLPLALLPGLDVWLVFGFVLLATLTEMTGVVAVQIGASRRYDGPMGKSDRALLVGLVTLLLGFGVTAGPWLRIVFAATLPLLAWTIARRASSALREARAPE
jgi:CDP-diacylglycerol--glycerol-3-phosphate 3-phosphatidyltransferase